MIFANTVAQAAGVARLLTDGGIECGLYHPDVLGPARRAALATAKCKPRPSARSRQRVANVPPRAAVAPVQRAKASAEGLA